MYNKKKCNAILVKQYNTINNEVNDLIPGESMFVVGWVVLRGTVIGCD